MFEFVGLVGSNSLNIIRAADRRGNADARLSAKFIYAQGIQLARILLTGATGFVGSVLCRQLADEGFLVRVARRNAGPLPTGAKEQVVVGGIDGVTDWGDAISGVQYVVHAAGRAHITGRGLSGQQLYREVNTDGTMRLARAALDAGIQRFVFVSTIKVNGEETGDRVLTRSSKPAPQDTYARSKHEAESVLLSSASGSSMVPLIIRPPLVYGPGVRANFLSLLQWVDRGIPLPVGAVSNLRSLVSVWNLNDLILRMLSIPSPTPGVWLVSDGVDVSTPDLVRKIAIAMQRRAKIIGLPVPILRALGRLTGRLSQVDRLCGSLRIDIRDTMKEFDWQPPMSMEEALNQTVAWYLKQG